MLGGIDSSRISGDIVYSPLASKSFWLIAQGGISINGQPVAGTTSLAALDSGASRCLRCTD